ncbi:MAG: Crp/Fnr family transcriptional regulator [Myxococcota bacterium]
MTPPTENAVRRLEVFRDTPPDAVRELLALAEMVPLAPEQVVYRQGEAIRRDALLLLSGRLSVFVEAGGARRAMTDVWPGEFVGEAGLFTRAPERTATVVASAPGYALRITRGLLADHVDQPAVVALEQHLVHTMSKRISTTNKALQRVLQEKGAPSGAPAASAPRPPRPATGRPAAPRPAEPLTLAQRLARWWNGEA